MVDNTQEASKEVQQPVATEPSINVVMYATRFCPYCMFARRLFKSKGVEFTEISVSENKLWDEMVEKSGGNTVPQILINDEPLGGYDDIAALDLKGELDKKLGR